MPTHRRSTTCEPLPSTRGDGWPRSLAANRVRRQPCSPSSSGASSTATKRRASTCTRRARDSLTPNVFGTPRFSVLYQRWLKHGDAVFEGQSSPVIAEALNTGAGRVESLVLPHTAETAVAIPSGLHGAGKQRRGHERIGFSLYAAHAHPAGRRTARDDAGVLGRVHRAESTEMVWCGRRNHRTLSHHCT